MAAHRFGFPYEAIAIRVGPGPGTTVCSAFPKGNRGVADKRAIEAHMTNLRRKLGDNPANPRYIETVRGVGYRLTSELSAS